MAKELLCEAEKIRQELGDGNTIDSDQRPLNLKIFNKNLNAKLKTLTMKSISYRILICLFFFGITLEMHAQDKPNVVYILVDDLGYGDLGCYGATKVKTPNIDQLASEGKMFTDAHSASAVCTPSRYALLTGQYPSRANNGKGIWGPAPVTSELLISPDQLTLADVFKNSGYFTAAIGKWHLGFGVGENDWQPPLSPGPNDLGFDYYYGIPVVNSAPPYVYVENTHVVGGNPSDPLVYLGRGKHEDATPLTPIPPEASQRTMNFFKGAIDAHKIYNDYTVGTVLTGKAVSWITEQTSREKQDPFFLYLATTHIHHPFTPGKDFQGKSDAALYGDFIQELDWMVGEVLSCLKREGVSDNTLVVFTSDNGAMLNLGGRNAVRAGHKINGDLLGFKFGAWEGGHRVPFIAKWPGKIEAGSSSDQLISNVDMLATFSAIIGQNLKDIDYSDSKNILPALTGNPTDPIRDELLLAAYRSTHLSLRKGKWMYIPAKESGGFRGSKPHQHAWGGAPAVAFVGGVNSDIEDGKIKESAPPGQLYNLEDDKNQSTNLYEKYPEHVREMEAILEGYRYDELQPSSLFSDHMVLQREMQVPIWGSAISGQKITVSFAGQNKNTVTDENGRWKVYLDPMETSIKGRNLVISGKSKIVISDVLVGEVWICSGQSNMQMNANAVPDIKALISKAKNIRSFEVSRTVSLNEEENLDGQWSDEIPKSAVAFSFAYFLEEMGDVPVGIIHSSWGSSSLEAWMPRDMTKQFHYFNTIMDDFDKDTLTQKRLNTILAKKEKRTNPEDIFLRRQPNILYNAMMKPLAPYAVRGLVWYQGERNTRYISGMPEVTEENWFHKVAGMQEYGDVLNAWIRRYRDEWESDEMHFMVVMLPGYGKGTTETPEIMPNDPSAQSWAWMRESQLKALQLPHTSVINTIDLGDLKDIHPKDKLPIGRRLAKEAAKKTLGQDIESMGPIIKSVEVKKRKLIVHFNNSEILKTTDGNPPSGFFVADKSMEWKPANAKISGQTVILESDEIRRPLYIRYAFSGKPDVNLVNGANMPAYPFRTDKN